MHSIIREHLESENIKYPLTHIMVITMLINLENISKA